MDPYVYDGTNVLINRLNIRDECDLIDVEAQLFIANVLDISSIVHQINFQTYESLQSIHSFLFHELYTWAGEFRTVNIYKAERVLNGLSITYSDKSNITSELQKIFDWTHEIQWNYDNPKLTEDFAIFMTKLWRVHPFREGNTRAVSIFMNLFAEDNKLEFNGQILSQHPGYLRKALVLSAVEEAPEPQYLLKVLKDALNLIGNDNTKRERKQSNKYKVIKQYDVTNYKQKPFETE